jgi:hypothetical protein
MQLRCDGGIRHASSAGDSSSHQFGRSTKNASNRYAPRRSAPRLASLLDIPTFALFVTTPVSTMICEILGTSGWPKALVSIQNLPSDRFIREACLEY